MSEIKRRRGEERERTERRKERDVGIICVIIYDDLALKAWTQKEGEGDRENNPFSEFFFIHAHLCY